MSDLPYPAATWQAVEACGAAVETALGRQGVLLTMGGEPTFVPFNPEGAEWQTAMAASIWHTGQGGLVGFAGDGDAGICDAGSTDAAESSSSSSSTLASRP